ncbi:MAG: DUF1559 domain-containing protein [Gemmataceae bacterium]
MAARIGWQACLCVAAAVATQVALTAVYAVETDLLDLRLATVCTFGLLTSLAAVWTIGLWVRLAESRGRASQLGSRIALWSMIVATFFPCFSVLTLPACSMTAQAGRRALEYNQFQQIAMAILNYHDAYKQLPPAAIRSPDGRPLLSWRVAVLPFIDEDALYKQFRLDEPWNSAHNLALLPRMPALYSLPYGHSTPSDRTFVQVVVGPGTAFECDGLTIPRDFPDGTSETFLIVEASEAVLWTQPSDVAFDPSGPLPRLGAVLPGSITRARRGNHVICALGDGSARSFQLDRPESIRARITRNGGEKPPDD